MKDGVIIYAGKYGSTDQYAHWLGQKLSLPLLDAESTTPEKLADYHLVIIGSSVYVGKLVIGKWLQHNASILSKKELFLFIVCGTTAEDAQEQQKIINSNLPPVLAKTTEIFFLPGRCVVKQLSWKDWFVLKMGAMIQHDPQKKAIMNRGFDYMDQKHLEPLIAAVRQLEKQS